MAAETNTKAAKPATKPATKPAPKPALPMEELVAHIKRQAHLDRDFDGGGWDVVEDTWTDEQIAEAIQGAKTKLGAQSKMAKHVNAYRAEKKAAKKAAKTQATEAA